MAKSECRICPQYSCESLTVKQEDGSYEKDVTRRFRFIKVDGAIDGGGIVNNSIDNCEIKARNQNNNQKGKVIEIDPNKIQEAINKEIKKTERKRKKNKRHEYHQRQNLIS